MEKSIKMGIYIEPRSAKTKSMTLNFYLDFRRALSSTTQYAKMLGMAIYVRTSLTVYILHYRMSKKEAALI